MAIADEVKAPQNAEDYEYTKNGETENRETSNNSKNKKMGKGSKIFTVSALSVVAVCVAILVINGYQDYEAVQNHKDIKVIYNEAAKKDEAVQATPEAPIVSDAETQEIIRQPLVISSAAEEMLAINKDYAGYLYIPDVLSEAVVKGQDNEYYLDHNIYDQKRSCGTVYADFRNNVNDYRDLQSDNIVLYGHNQKDGTMFGNMDYYKWDSKYWLKNPFIYFDNLYESGTYVIISSFVTNTDPAHDNGNVFDYLNYIEFDNTTYTYEKFIDEITTRSQFHTGIDVNEDDKFLTLSTCAYEWNEARHVIVARRLRPGETTDSIDTTNFAVNPNPKWPAIYYKYNGGSYSG